MTAIDHRPERPDAWVDVVGESHYQRFLEEAGGRRQDHGVSDPDHKAILVPEPDNPVDRNAVAVNVQTGPSDMVKAGYIAATAAPEWQAVFRLIAPAEAIRCDAKLTGGWDRGYGDTGSIGVVLWLGKPIAFATEWIADKYPLRRDHPWVGQTVVFAGKSWCALVGLRLDKLAQEYLAGKAGCVVAPRVTKSIGVCVTGDPAFPTAEVSKAQGYGVQVVPEGVFWNTVGLRVETVGPA
jgi:hypothetical protein